MSNESSMAFVHVTLPSSRKRTQFRRLVCASQANTPAVRFSRREFAAVLALAVSGLATHPPPALAEPLSIYELSARKDKKDLPLSFLNGKVTLFVNVASYCALTPQYAGLVELHDTYQSRGFEVVAAPCDQFGRQEPGSDEEICEFAKKRFGARFLLLDKLNVNDAPGGVAPLYKALKKEAPEYTGQRISWNFEKFLVGADGRVLRRYKPGILPEDISRDVEYALSHPLEALPPRPKPYLGVA